MNLNSGKCKGLKCPRPFGKPGQEGTGGPLGIPAAVVPGSRRQWKAQGRQGEALCHHEEIHKTEPPFHPEREEQERDEANDAGEHPRLHKTKNTPHPERGVTAHSGETGLLPKDAAETQVRERRKQTSRRKKEEFH